MSDTKQSERARQRDQRIKERELALKEQELELKKQELNVKVAEQARKDNLKMVDMAMTHALLARGFSSSRTTDHGEFTKQVESAWASIVKMSGTLPTMELPQHEACPAN